MLQALSAFVPVRALSDAPQRLAAIEGPDLSRYFTVCAMLLIAIVGVGYGFRRLIAGAVRAKAANRSLQILDVLPLFGKQRLCVVRCYDRTFALGLGDREVTLISELDPPAQPRTRETEAHERAAFERALESARSGRPGPVEQRGATRAGVGARMRRLLRGESVLG